MTPELLIKLLLVASQATTDEQKARVLWRANDTLWAEPISADGVDHLTLCRLFNNLVQDMNLPLVEKLWPKDDPDRPAAKYEALLNR